MDVETWGAEKSARIQRMLLCIVPQRKEISFRVIVTNNIPLGWKEYSGIDSYLAFRDFEVDQHYVSNTASNKYINPSSFAFFFCSLSYPLPELSTKNGNIITP